MSTAQAQQAYTAATYNAAAARAAYGAAAAAQPAAAAMQYAVAGWVGKIEVMVLAEQQKDPIREWICGGYCNFL